LIGKPVQGPAEAIVRDIRLPRLILAVLVGAALAVAGTAMQGFFQNPMADPYVVGVSSGAALGATLGMVLHIDFWIAGLSATPVFAFAGALGTTFLVYALSLRGGRVPVGLLLLIGVAVGALAAAATSFLMIIGDKDLRLILFWLLGSLSSRRWDHVQMILPYVILGITLIWAYARDLNLFLLGEETAQHTGVEVEQVKRIVLSAAALLAAAAVSVSGIIGFVGLIVPHLMRLIVGPDHRRLIPISALSGALLMVQADVLARTLAAPSEIPIGIITSALGCPFFLLLIARRKDIVF
jgi:iron complex transport system permease protein